MGKARRKSDHSKSNKQIEEAPQDRLSLTTTAIFGAIGAAIIWHATSLYGIGVTPDSVRYLSAAQSFLDGDGFTLYNGQPLITSPPLYPALLAALSLFGLKTVTAARALNIALFAAIIMATDRWLAGRFRWRLIGDLMVVGVLLSISLIDIAVSAWTETLFALLVLIFLIVLERQEGAWSSRGTTAMGVVTALACLTRYIGVIIIPYFLLWLFLSELDMKTKLRRGITYSSVGLVPLVLWLGRNLWLSDTLTGNRQGSVFPLTDIMGQTASAVVNWFYTPVYINRLIALIAIGVIVTAVAAFYWLENRHGLTRNNLCRRLAVPGFATYYILCLTAMACVIDFDKVGNRLASPAFVPLLLTLFIVLDHVASGGRRTRRRIKQAVVLVLCLTWLGGNLYRTYTFVSDTAANGTGGYATTSWQQSEMVSYLESRPLSGPLYTNGPDVVYLMTGQKALLSPRRSGPSLSGSALGLDAFKDVVDREGSVYLAWFTEIGRPYMYSPKDLSQHFRLLPQGRVKDGTLYLALPPVTE